MVQELETNSTIDQSLRLHWGRENVVNGRTLGRGVMIDVAASHLAFSDSFDQRLVYTLMDCT